MVSYLYRFNPFNKSFQILERWDMLENMRHRVLYICYSEEEAKYLCRIFEEEYKPKGSLGTEDWRTLLNSPFSSK